MGEFFGYYLSDFNPFDSNRIQSGIDRKIIAQIKAFNNAGLKCEHIEAVRPSNTLLKGIASLPVFPDLISWPDVDSLGSPAYLYIRRPAFSTKGFISFLSKFRKHNPNALVMIEIPTFPYDKEFDTPQLFFALRKDRHYREEWRSFVDYCVVPTAERSVFGLPCICIMNGIDLEEIKVRTPSFKTGSPIEIVFPASFAAYHGCDLLLLGLAHYYRAGGSRDIRLHLAGEGSASATNHNLIQELHLQNHVIEHGMLDKDSLDKLYNQCTLAVGSLGMHRIGSIMSAALKTREYLAKGIPFFYAGQIDVFERAPVDFSLQFESKEEPIDIKQVIEFHDRLYESESEISLIERIRRYAEENVSMDAAMSSVINLIEEHNS